MKKALAGVLIALGVGLTACGSGGSTTTVQAPTTTVDVNQQIVDDYEQNPRRITAVCNMVNQLGFTRLRAQKLSETLFGDDITTRGGSPSIVVSEMLNDC
jgi:ABC-type glycerol-3-phosphate transport system substrate-binding protein